MTGCGRQLVFVWLARHHDEIRFSLLNYFGI